MSLRLIDFAALDLVTGGAVKNFSDGTSVDTVYSGWNSNAIQIIDKTRNIVCYGLQNESTGGAHALSCLPIKP